jgi:putative transposase
MTRQCELLNISRSMVYYNPKVMSPYNKQIMDRIDEIYTDNPDYGYLYIYHQLLEEGYTMGRDRTLKYMNLMGLQAIFPKKKKNVSLQDKSHKIYPYLLEHYWKSSNGSKSVDVPNANEFWSGDITYIRTINGFMYMAAIIDWHSKAILGYKLSNCMDATLVTTILQEALDKYLPPLIFNSDQGSQYTGSEHTSLLKNYGVQISMNGKGRSIDNIPIESFFRTLKYNCIFINEFNNIFELKEVIKSYVDKYNNERFYSSIGYQKPMNVYLNALKNVA